MDIRDTYNLIAREWAQEHWEDRDTGCDDFFKIIAARIGDGSKVLDIGCGSGEDCKFLAGLGLQAWGVDIAAGLIQEAKSRYPQGKFQVMAINQLDFPTATFRAVIAKKSLLHLPKKEIPAVLNRINDLLEKEGWFFLVVKEGFGERAVKQERFGHQIKRLYSFFTNFEMQKLLEGAGFKIVDEGIYKDDHNTILKFLAQKVA